ncbi:uncharacterized protein CPUR_05409 [Claviceps purpurea 20.1]|uniref:BTB domain-containing protein n=1 Tax=Claviceps purpurea (strain 20.1) TaxID=1111077 RepID=M1W263_CLAP2|nr:uncharacterized protein CPUR_05409 [Claviceps purpurea 20.1]
MQASPYEDSRPFKFMVGKAKKEFFLHSALVASKSEVLGKMMNGPFIEGQQGYVTLPDEGASTIAAFVEFAFTGDYKITIALDTSPQFAQSIEYGFEAKTADAPVLDEGNMHVDFSEVFIAHAKVYIFADCYGVAGLLNLAMQKLHKALSEFRLSVRRMGSIVSLVSYCYERPCPGKLKKMVASYSAAIMDSQVTDVAACCFQKLLEDRGDFAAEMAWFMACRLRSSQDLMSHGRAHIIEPGAADLPTRRHMASCKKGRFHTAWKLNDIDDQAEQDEDVPREAWQ